MNEELLDDGDSSAREPLGIASSRRWSLVIVSPTGTGNVSLPERGSLTLGRSPACDVYIDDAKLSRRHAEIRCDGEVRIVDLGSRNGTRVRDERIAPNVPVTLRSGDSFAVGATVLVLQTASGSVERPRHVWSHGYFEARLEEECAGASPESPFSIIRLRLEPTAAGDAADPKTTQESRGPAEQTAPSALVRWLRPTDMLGDYGPDEYEVLLTKTPHAEAETRVSELALSLHRDGVSFGIALASHGRDGRTPEALFEETSRRLRRATGSRTEPPREAIAKGALERMEPIVARVAAGVINVLVLGETGVGKEVLSRRIHALSPRANEPMVSLNCAALSESLLESELFGHEKGAFTGALQAKVGLLESAQGGTVFLDEIGEMPLSVQAKLLRVIEQREVTRVGALRPRAIDVRFVSATHRDLEQEIARGRFRQDLYFRLNGIALTIPPLRDRVDEIEPLARALIAQACRTTSRATPLELGAGALEALESYAWPGNIRELRNVIERAVLLCSDGVITRAHLPMEKLEAVPAPQARISFAPPARADRASDAPPTESEAERRRILDALEQCAGNQSHAAKRLGMSRQTFIRRLEEHGIARPRKRE